ncbi:hypothetical protein CEXT_85491 [Caerostris extrusa]|uniref:Uncharacterized protein n=1 Tax=Caerostris extrusa TaxID=172846 RepID=A0AAV4RIC2_CAEEX|nr:hypothetical protein CEXT_85491 [Caerostris extrusa]
MRQTISVSFHPRDRRDGHMIDQPEQVPPPSFHQPRCVQLCHTTQWPFAVYDVKKQQINRILQIIYRCSTHSLMSTKYPPNVQQNIHQMPNKIPTNVQQNIHQMSNKIPTKCPTKYLPNDVQ